MKRWDEFAIPLCARGSCMHTVVAHDHFREGSECSIVGCGCTKYLRYGIRDLLRELVKRW